MKERSLIYNIRRKLQVKANQLTSYEFMSKLYYFIIFKKKLNLENPLTFNEKLQWLKLNYYPKNQKIITCTDKYLVRNYIKDLGKEQYLNKLIGDWDSWEEIDWDNLPEKFALKCNHGCGYNIICKDKSKLDIKVVEKKIKTWMSEDFSLFNAEKHYTSIPKKIICEEYLDDEIIDYKFFCFHGQPKFFYIAQGFGDGINERMSFFNMDGTPAEFTRSEYSDFSDSIQIPEKLDEMINLSKDLSKDFPFVRVDLFQIKGQIIFSELTFTPGGGLMRITPQDYDKKLGDLLNLQGLIS